MDGSEGFGIVGDRLIFIQAEVTRIRANETFVENATGELIEFFFFYGAEKSRANFSGLGHIIQCDLALFSFAFQPLAEGSHFNVLLPALLPATECEGCTSS